MVSSRGATTRPRSRRRSASAAASVHERSYTASQPASASTSCGGDGRGGGLGRERGGVVPAGVGMQRRLERAPRLGEVHVRRADREDVLTPVGSDPQHPGPDRPAQPLLA